MKQIQRWQTVLCMTLGAMGVFAQADNLQTLKDKNERLHQSYGRQLEVLNDALVKTGCKKAEISFDPIQKNPGTDEYIENKMGQIEHGPKAPKPEPQKPAVDCPNLSAEARAAQDKLAKIAKDILLNQLRYSLRVYEIGAKKHSEAKAYEKLGLDFKKILGNDILKSLDSTTRATVLKTADEFLKQAKNPQTSTEAGLKLCRDCGGGVLESTRQLIEQIKDAK